MVSQQVVINIPQAVLVAEGVDAETFAREVQLLAAIKLFELRRFSSTRAGELAGLSRLEFMLTLGRYKVFPFLAELEELEQQNG